LNLFETFKQRGVGVFGKEQKFYAEPGGGQETRGDLKAECLVVVDAPS